MFKWLNKQGVRSDEGFELQFTGRFTAEYREHARTIPLDIEAGLRDGNPSIILRIDSIDKVVGQAERDRILANIRAALEFQGLGLDVG